MELLTNDFIQIHKFKVKEECSCESCNNDIMVNEIRYKWRMRVQNDRYFHHGSFWCEQCASCFDETCEGWSRNLIEARGLVNEAILV